MPQTNSTVEPDPETLLPLTPAVFSIMLALADGQKHGYAIMSDIEALVGVAIGPGTLYTAITRLVEKKLVAADPTTGRQRPYRLTAEGAKLLAEQLADMRRVAAVGLRRLRLA